MVTRSSFIKELVGQGIDIVTAELMADNAGLTDGTGGVPFKLFKVNSSDTFAESGVKKGNFILGGRADKDDNITEAPVDLGLTPTVTILAMYNQLAEKYDPSVKGKKYKTSNIFQDRGGFKTAYDLESGTKMTVFKDAGLDIKSQKIMLLLVKLPDGTWEPAVWYCGGATLLSMNQGLEKLTMGVFPESLVLTTTKQKNGATTYYPAEVTSSAMLVAKDFITAAMESTKSMKSWVEGVNTGTGAPTTSAPIVSTPVVDDDDVEIAF